MSFFQLGLRQLPYFLAAFLLSSTATFSQGSDDLSDIMNTLRSRGVIFDFPSFTSVQIPLSARVTDDDMDLLKSYVEQTSGPLVSLSLLNHGVTTTGLASIEEFRNLRSITLAAPGVSDSVLPLFSNLQFLRWLRLAGPIKGETLSSLQTLANLQELSFSGKNPSRWVDHRAVELTDEGMRQLGTLTQLQKLELSNCGVRDSQFHSLSEMKNLERLWINRSPMSGVGLSQLPTSQLKSLLITRSGLSDRGTARLPPFPSLVGLNLTDNQIGDGTVAALAKTGADRLSQLSLIRTDVTDRCVEDLAKLPSLNELHLQMTKVKGRGFRQLGSLKNLTFIGLSRTDVDDVGIAEIAQLKNVTQLGLDNTPITDKCATDFMKMKQLEYLFLSEGAISKPVLDALQKALPNCEIVEAANPPLPNIESLPY